MSTFDSFVILRVGFLHLSRVLILELVVVVVTASIHVIHPTSIVIVVATSHSHVVLTSTTSEVTPSSVVVHLHWPTSTSVISSCSILIIGVVAVLPLDRFESDLHLFGSQWIIGFPQLLITMGEMTLITEDAITMGFVMSAPLCLVFLVDLVFL